MHRRRIVIYRFWCGGLQVAGMMADSLVCVCYCGAGCFLKVLFAWKCTKMICFSDFFLTSAHQNHRKTLKEHQFDVFSSQMHFWNAKTATSSMNAGLLIDLAIRQNPHMKDLCSCLDIWTMFFCTAGIKVLVEHRCWYGRNLLFIPVLLCFSFIMRVVIWLEKEASPFAF